MNRIIEDLKLRFSTGKKPSGADFELLIDVLYEEFEKGNYYTNNEVEKKIAIVNDRLSEVSDISDGHIRRENCLDIEDVEEVINSIFKQK